jgi:hypothetical protein
MPVEIRELQIITTVQDGGKSSSASSSKGSSGGGGSDDMIAKCVEQVLEILREKNER